MLKAPPLLAIVRFGGPALCTAATMRAWALSLHADVQALWRETALRHRLPAATKNPAPRRAWRNGAMGAGEEETVELPVQACGGF